MTIPWQTDQLRIEQRLATAPAVWLGIDFDGTLASHQPTPERVELLPEVRSLLGALAELPQVAVAIISGRPLADVQRRIAHARLGYAGDHGQQIAAPGLDWSDAVTPIEQLQLGQIADRLRQRLVAEDRRRLELKSYSISLNCWDCTPEQKVSIRDIANLVASDFPAVFVRDGRHGCELLLRNRAHKGTAVRTLSAHQSSSDCLPIYIGDDATDEDAFAAIPEGITLCVGPHPTLARYRASSPGDAFTFLQMVCSVRSRLAAQFPKLPQPRP